ncbi:MAG: hypothetical protein HY425_02785 [Candidatus Levybacteria bacterium]|nr:hypothetical protein [Candidatus Levybacteria bacterium]
MVSEKDLSGHNNPLELLRGSNIVLADSFTIRTNGFPDQLIRQDIANRLSRQGITGPVTVTFCNSKQKKVEEIITSLKLKKALNAAKDPWMGIITTTTDDARALFERISVLLTTKDPITEGMDGKDITILQLNADLHNTITDMRTGLKIVTLKKGELAHPMHPTPAD